MEEKRVKEELQKLIDKFERIKNEGKYKTYNEENTKKDFILPLFRILGWNVEDSGEVKAEEKVSKKRVDYAFRLHGVPKFYLECKPFREFISDPKYAKQAIEYAWNKSVTWAILCNFEGIRVFNAEWKWDDKQPMRNQFLDLRYNEYTGSCFKYLTWLSKESFEQGVLDQQATVLGKKAKKLPIGQQLLADFTEYRNILSKDILKNNQKMDLSQDDLDETVQRILDRIIFIRTCEDKEIESEKLESLVRIYGDKEGRLYKKLNEKFREYDEGYNSKLFLEHICEKVIISNDVLKQIIFGTYRSKTFDIRYDFSAIDADVLGNIYEQYLGHILKSTAKRAQITNGKTHRKEQGIYYTPTYIVDYIVRNTLGELLKKRGIKVDEIKILDPACGSGSFLLKTYDILSEYIAKKEGRAQQTRFEDAYQGSSKLLKRKTELLKNCIFGVDLDVQAVEIAQLNLLLKLAEKRQRLPTLQENIKCGNSLIDDPNIVGNHAFDWNTQFKDIMERAKFDIVVGNPPYGAELNSEERDFISKKYPSASSYKNTALVFIELAYNLVKKGGYVGLIVPKSLAFSQKWNSCRDLIKKDLIKIVDVSKAFEGVLLEQVIIILKKGSNNKTYTIDNIDNPGIETVEVDKKYINQTDSIIINRFKDDLKIFERVNKDCIYLKDISKTSRGLPFQKYVTENKSKYRIFRGKNIGRFLLRENNEFLPNDKVDLNNEKIKFLLQPKVISQRIVAHVTKPKDHIIIMSTLDKEGILSVDTVENTIIEDKNYPLELINCLFNSKFISWYAYRFIFAKAIRTMDFDDYYVGKIPIPKKISDIQKIIDLNNRISKLYVELESVSKFSDKENEIKREIDKIDEQIDMNIYDLYGLSQKEMKVIEESLKE